MSDPIEPTIKAAEICAAIGRTPRNLYDHIKRNRFPAPDYPARRHGEPNLWKASTARRGIEAFLSGTTHAAA